MPKQILLALSIELMLIVMTLVFLIQPRIIMPFQSLRVRNSLRGGGWLLLCITFCWSVVLGVLLTLSRMNASV